MNGETTGEGVPPVRSACGNKYLDSLQIQDRGFEALHFHAVGAGREDACVLVVYSNPHQLIAHAPVKSAVILWK